MEMGTGKSKVACDEACQLHLDGTIDQVLIFAGAGSYSDWTSIHLPENIPKTVQYHAHLWDGGRTKRERDALTLLMNSTVLRVLVMNIESLVSRTADTVAKNFVNAGDTLIVVDESTKIKSETALRSMAVTRLGRRAVVRRVMTGSAVTQSPMDLWGQLTFLGIEQNFASNFYSFRARFCKLTDIRLGLGAVEEDGSPAKSRTVKKITGYQNLDRLEKLLAAHSFRVLKEECLDLPPKVYEVCRVELTPEQQRLYREMAKLATTEIQTGIWSTAANAMGRLQKMHQIILGHLVDEAGVIHGLPTNRPAALADLAEEAGGEKIVIWTAYRRDVTLVLEELAKRFPDRTAVRYDGTVPANQRAAAVRSFQSGEAAFFVGTAATGAFGLTLTAACNVIYYSNDFSLEHRLQSEDRCHRDGQTRSVTYVDMFTPGSIEEKIVRILREKRTVAEVVMGDPAKEWLSWLE